MRIVHVYMVVKETEVEVEDAASLEGVIESAKKQCNWKVSQTNFVVVDPIPAKKSVDTGECPCCGAPEGEICLGWYVDDDGNLQEDDVEFPCPCFEGPERYAAQQKLS